MQRTIWGAHFPPPPCERASGGIHVHARGTFLIPSVDICDRSLASALDLPRPSLRHLSALLLWTPGACPWQILCTPPKALSGTGCPCETNSVPTECGIHTLLFTLLYTVLVHHPREKKAKSKSTRPCSLERSLRHALGTPSKALPFQSGDLCDWAPMLVCGAESSTALLCSLCLSQLFSPSFLHASMI